jgi:hypothetical protein
MNCFGLDFIESPLLLLLSKGREAYDKAEGKESN